jgi:hypothetical protein
MSGEGVTRNQPPAIAARIRKRAEDNLYEAYPVLRDLPYEVWEGISYNFMEIDEAQLPDNKALNMYCEKARDVIRDALAKQRFDMEPANKADFSAFLRDPKRVDEYRAALATKGVALKSKLQVSSMPEANKAGDALAIEQFADALESLAQRIDRAVPTREKTGRTAEI